MNLLSLIWTRLRGFPSGRLMGRVSSGTGAPEALTAAQGRSLLALGNAATRDVGTASGTVCAGDDARLSGMGIGGSTGGTDNAALRADGTDGTKAQGSLVGISDAGDVTTPGCGCFYGGVMIRKGSSGRTYEFSTNPEDHSILRIARSDNPTAYLNIAVSAANVQFGSSGSSPLGIVNVGAPIDLTPANGGGAGLVRLGRREPDQSQYVGAGLQVFTCHPLFDPGNTPAINVLSPGGSSSVFSVDKTGGMVCSAPSRPGAYMTSGVPLASTWPGYEIAIINATPAYRRAFSDGTAWRYVNDNSLV